MRILHSISSLSRASGGPSRSVVFLCNQLGAAGASVNILAVGCEPEYENWVLPNSDFVTLNSSQAWGFPGLRVRFCPSFASKIAGLHAEKTLNIIHDHGLWLPNNHASTKTAKALGVPLIVSTRGMLEPWALKYRGWKKKLVWRMWQKAALDGAVVLHATSPGEADNLRTLGLKNPIAVIPNGVDLPRLSHARKCNAKTALFLSRIHPVKGLLNLVEAWSKVRPKGWRMVIAGPSEENHHVDINRAIENCGLADQFEFFGSVDDHQKWELYQQADIFVLPTFSENFGIVVAEALAAEVPVITTKGAPWRDLEELYCGWWVDVGADPLADALSEAMALSDEERLEMGRRGRKLIKEKYSWDKIASDMLDVYKWVQSGGRPPDCVRLD